MAMFQILGPVRLFARGGNVDLGPAKVRGLLGILLLSAGTAVPVELIAERLWDLEEGSDRHPPPHPRKTLQQYVSKLRHALKTTAAPAKVLTEHRAYRLKVDLAIVDYYRFRQLANEAKAAARTGDHAGAITAFQAAIDLWHGPPLADIKSSWSTSYGDMLVRQELLPTHCGLLESHLALGHHDEVLARLRPLLVAHETEESLMALRMRALAAVDGPASVTAPFHDFVQKLRDELGTPPSDWLVQLYRSLTEQPAAEPTASEVHHKPQQLPRDIRHFIGRLTIMQVLDDLLVTPDGSPAVVVLYGTPGVGKTAVATRWAHRCSDHFPDGILHVDLNGYGPSAPTSATTVLALFLDALGVPQHRVPRDASERATLLRHELTGRRILVVLDNARDSAHVKQLLTATSPCPVLITSRQKLPGPAYWDGAHSLTLPTLAVDEAIALLELRIGGHRVVRDLPAVHALAARCSHLPLALHIAGEYVAARPDAPVSDLIEHLSGPRRLLDANSHDDDDTANLRAIFDWSANALPSDADRLFCLLGLYPSSQASTPAAAALVGWSIERTERAFNVLIDAHLAQQQSKYSYRLHDLLYDYAGDRAHTKVQPEERREAVHRLVDWYLHTVTNAILRVSPDRKPVPPLPLGTSVRPQTFADHQEALRWCVAERAQVLAVCACANENGFYDHVWRLIGTFDSILYRFGDPHDLVGVHRVALDAARVTGSRDGETGCLNNLGVLHFYLGEYEIAARYYGMALAIAREIDDEFFESAALFNIGSTLFERRSYQKAAELYQQSLVIAQRNDDRPGQSGAYHRLGEVYQRWEQPARAEEFYRMALSIESDDSRDRAATLAKLGELCVERDDPQQALDLCAQALLISRSAFDDRRTAAALTAEAQAFYRLGRHEESIVAAEEAAALRHNMNDTHGEARTLEILAQAQQAVGDRTTADHNREKALSLLSGSDATIVGRIRTALMSESEPPVPDPRETRQSQSNNCSR